MGKSTTEQNVTPFNQLFNGPFVGTAPGVVDWIAQSTDAQRKLHDELLDITQRLVDRWCERRHATVGAICECTQATLDPGDPGAVAGAWATWYRGAVERVAEDARDQAEAAMAVMRAYGNGGIPAPGGAAAAKPDGSAGKAATSSAPKEPAK